MHRTELPCLLVLLSLILVSCQPSPTPKEPITTDKQPAVQPGEPPVIVGDEPAAKDESTEKPIDDLSGLPTPKQARPDLVAEVQTGNRTAASAAWWGFDPKDSTKTLQAAFDSGARTVLVPKMGRHWYTSATLHLRSDQAVTLAPGARIVARPGFFKKLNEALVMAKGVNNIALTGGEGSALAMRKKEYNRGQWRHALAVLSCKNVHIEGIMFRDSGGDGIYIGNARQDDLPKGCIDVVVRNVRCHNNRRMGLTVISGRNVLIEDSLFDRQAGTAPQAGMDFEPNLPEEFMENIIVRNCVSEFNTRNGVNVSLQLLREQSRPISLRFEHCIFRGSREARGVAFHFSPDDSPADGKVVFEDCLIEGNHATAVSIYEKSYKAYKILFRDCTFRYELKSVKPPAGFRQLGWPLVHFSSKDTEFSREIGNVHFEDCTFDDPRDVPLMIIRPQHVPASKVRVRNVTGNIRLISPHDPAVWLPGEDIDLDFGRPTRPMNDTTVNASWFGFLPDDATHCIQNAIDSGAGKVVIPKWSKPWVVRPIQLASNQTLRIQPGVEILAKKGAYRSNSACLFEARNVENLKILGGKDVVLRMNRDEYGDTGQWRHTLSLRGCTNVEVRDLTLLDSGGDGVYVGTGVGEGSQNYCKDVVLAGLVSKNHYRQGISVITAENLLIDQCILSDIHGCKGAAFGLDIEPNKPAERLVNVVVRDTQMGPNPGTGGMGISLTHFDRTTRPVSIRFEGCTVRGGSGRTAGGVAKCRPGLGGTVVFDDCDITSFALLNKAVTGPEVVVRNTIFRRPEDWPDDIGVIRFIVKKREGMSRACGNTRFENCTVYSKDDLIVSHQVIKLDAGEASFADIKGVLKVEGTASPRADLPGENVKLELVPAGQ